MATQTNKTYSHITEMLIDMTLIDFPTVLGGCKMHHL